ncbi:MULTISPECIES: hypothetical protein [Halobacterium]|uniref:Uncharacterized protein n=4 Tax=Halobacterium salinarum TaxID=2242 RepID=A0A510N4C0_HALSA|nr:MULTISPECIES: hypothetical protein [Halobacterium]MBB6090708.1 hypothetical protein [Halobacterium salinarum]MCF2164212.1 hypothetical protein [Halobacterium salinarum]MCF2166738.1 hypothetical protein [Halobacterium salinarum]MCF2208030.1 hypothetical protein [Halobacterium salinarum]MCF2237875.1 hypothetical protein [Halobacterium salinarum]
MPVQTRHARPEAATSGRRVEVSAMTTAGVAAYAATHRTEHTYIERRGGRTYVVTRE